MKTLLIVDIQNKYRHSFNEDYLNEVIDYLKRTRKVYDKIVCIMEQNQVEGDYIPSEIYKKLNFYPIFKSYNAKYTLDKLKNSKNFIINKGSIQSLINIPSGSFLFREQDGYVIGNRGENEIELDYINQGLYHLLNSLRDDDITIIGGGLHNCVKKTKKFLKFLNIDSSIDFNMCYTIEEDDEACDENRFDFFVKKKN